MARIGKNPLRHTTSTYRPANVTVAILVSIPETTGYFQHRLDVLRLCLASLQKHTPQEHDVLVFDNGSCRPVSKYLQRLCEHGVIQYLMTSQYNIGKIGAWQLMLRAAPGKVIAYADDDIFFYPNWIDAHLTILDTYPRVGMVSGWAIRSTFDYGNHSVLQFAQTQPTVHLERGRFLPEAWERDFAKCTGRDPEAYLSDTAQIEDIRLVYQQVAAYATAQHFQFIGKKEVLTSALPEEWSGRYMGKMREYDEMIDRSGYLRLSTLERCVYHIGNVITPEIAALARQFGIDTQPTVNYNLEPIKQPLHPLMHIPIIRGILWRVYQQLKLIVEHP